MIVERKKNIFRMVWDITKVPITGFLFIVIVLGVSGGTAFLLGKICIHFGHTGLFSPPYHEGQDMLWGERVLYPISVGMSYIASVIMILGICTFFGRLFWDDEDDA